MCFFLEGGFCEFKTSDKGKVEAKGKIIGKNSLSACQILVKRCLSSLGFCQRNVKGNLDGEWVGSDTFYVQTYTLLEPVLADLDYFSKTKHTDVVTFQKSSALPGRTPVMNEISHLRVSWSTFDLGIAEQTCRTSLENPFRTFPWDRKADFYISALKESPSRLCEAVHVDAVALWAKC